MPCPDEDTFARFVQGLLPAEAAAEIERHVDGCARCADLAAEFGSLYAEAERSSSHASGRLPWWVLMAAATLHAAWTIVMRIWPGGLDGVIPTAVAGPYTLYLELWGPVGCLIAARCALGLARGRAWARAVAFWYAVVSLPSVIMTPLAIAVLVLRGRDRRQRTAS